MTEPPIGLTFVELSSLRVTGQVLWSDCLCSDAAAPDQDAGAAGHFAWRAVPQALISIG
jgi:hypothetical protein